MKSIKMLSLSLFALAMAGVVLVCVGGVRAFHLNPVGDLLALCAMMCWSVYSVLITRANARGIEPTLAIRRVFFWALMFMLPLLPYTFDFTPTVNVVRFAKAWNLVHLGFLGFFASALAFVLWSATCRALGTVRATCGLYFIPVVTAVVAYFALGESLTAMTGIGAILTLIGVSLSSKKVKGGMGMNLGVGIALSFGYIVFQTISSTFAVNGNTPPLVAVWIPNVVFLIIGIYLYWKAPK